jgi:hypothetical protein
MSGDGTHGGAEELFSRTKELQAKLDQTDDPDVASDILERLIELLKEVEAEIRKARHQAETGAGG